MLYLLLFVMACSNEDEHNIPSNPAGRAELIKNSVQYLEMYNKKNPTDAYSHYVLACYYYENEDYDNAYFALKKAISLKKKVIENYHFLMVKILLKKKLYYDAQEYFSKIENTTSIPENELNPIAFEVYYKSNNLKKANILSERINATEIAQDANLMANKAKLKLNMGDTQQAIMQYKILLSNTPSDTHTVVTLAKLYMGKQMYDSCIYALENYKKSTNSEILYMLGQCYKADKQKDSAQKYYEKCLMTDSSHAEAIYALGIIHLQANRHKNALKYFLKYKSIDSLKPNLNFKIATSYKKLHKKTMALKYFALIDTTDINYKFAQQSIKNLNTPTKKVIDTANGGSP